MSVWKADITNDPRQNYDLIVEIYDNDLHRGTISRSSSGDLKLTIHKTDEAIEIPARWLREILERAERDLSRRER